MEHLIIKPSKNTPFVSFNKNGEMLIEGRSYPSESVSFFQPLFEWVKKYRGDDTKFKIKLEYFNTSTCKQLLSLLRVLYDNNSKEKVHVEWCYEENDLDLLEIGEHMESILGVKFIFTKYIISSRQNLLAN